MRLNRVGSSVLSAMTQTPASGPCGPETTPPMSFAPIAIAAGAFCGCARAGTDTPANNAAATTNTGSLFLIFMSPSLPVPAGPALFQRDLLDLRKGRRSDVPILTERRAESTEHARSGSGPRAADVAVSIELPLWVGRGLRLLARSVASESCRNVARSPSPASAGHRLSRA